MKVTLPKKMKDIITLSEAPIVNTIINSAKDDCSTPADYATMAAQLITQTNTVKVLEAKAEICKQRTTHDAFFEGSGDFDIWVNFTAFNSYDSEFIMGGALLSDIWQIAGDDRREEFMDRWYIRRFKEV